MNRRDPGLVRPRLTRLASCLALSAAVLVSAPPVGAQGIPDDLKTATSIPDDRRQVLSQWVKQQAADLSGSDVVKQAAARDALVAQTNGPAGQPASPTFLDAYASAINAEVLPLTKNEDLDVRLNAAILTAKVAQKADNTQLVPVAIALLGDKADPVAYWGLRSARYLLPAVLRNPLMQRNNKLQPAVVAAVKDRLTGPMGGAIASEGYNALSLNLLVPNTKADPNLKLVVGDMLDLFRTRVDLYKGATVPPEPTAELNATRFLAHPAVSPLQTKPQRLTTIQAMSDLVGLAAQHVQDADAQQRDALVLVIEGTTKAMWVAAADLKGNPAAVQAIQSALEPAMKITPQTPAAEVPGIVKGIFDPLAAHPDLKGITAPPTVEKPAEAPQVPAGQATTTRGAGGQ